MDSIIIILIDAVARVRCALGWHTWQYEPAQHTPTGTYGPCRMCAWCCAGVELAIEPPAGQPDTKTVDLTRDEKALLASLDAEFPKETSR